ncbi:hypothetical protein FRC02_002507 [Tulasnella sp. 418]|nr:hypothetical protein FRC02_002507 [Tulasnella sp. 418]
MLKIPSSGGNPMIRVDSPSDIVFVSDGDPILDGIRWQSGSTLPKVQRRPTTLEKWKALGDQQFREKQFLGAVLSYTEGIKLDATNTALLHNRAMAYLRLEFFSRALNDCRSALQLSGITDQDSVKALYRAGRALYGLGDWTGAKACFEDALKVNEAEKESRTWSAKCDARVREQETGDYEVVGIYRRSKSEGVRVDVADFVGNIEVASMKSRGGGRGVVATRELKAGELLVVAKPFASVFEEDFQGPKEMLMVFNLMTDTTDAKCHGYLISKITTMLFSDSSRADLIYHLYAGPSLDKPPSTYPPETNMTITTHQSSPLFNDQVAVDVSRIEGAASFNGFSPTPLSPVNTMEDDNRKDMDKLNSPSALYTFPSLFNHSCVPNCTQVFLGDVMMIRALQDIPEGTELTVSYGNDGNTYQKRIKHLKKWFNKCDCSLCEAERSDGAAANKTREEVLTKIKKAKQKPATRNSLQEAKRFVSQVQATYKGSTQSRLPRVALYTAHFHLGNQYRELGQNFELIEEHINAIKALGVKVIDESTSGPVRAGKKGKDLPIETDRAPSTPGNDEAVMTCLRLTAHFHRGLGDNVRAERWLRAARWIDNVRHGGGVALFTILYEEVLELWEISDFNRAVTS